MSLEQAIYLDNAATTPLDPEVADLLAALYRQPWANPASQHRAGRSAQAALEDAKDRIKAACLTTTHPTQLLAWQLVLTSGGTEANNLALRGLASAPDSVIVVSSIEHPSVLSLATEALGERCRVVPVDAGGQVNIDVLDAVLHEAAQQRYGRSAGRAAARPLVSIMAGNNETGICSDLRRVAEVCRLRDATLHCDAVQVFGKAPLADLLGLVDAVTISPHKVHGPVGVGALLYRSSLTLQPLLYGGGQQLGLRPGTESVPLAVAMAAACEYAEHHRGSGAMERVRELRTRLEAALLSADLGAEVIGAALPRLPHITSITFPGLDRQALLMALDLAGVQCSAGSACASGSSQPSHVLSAMRRPPAWVEGAVRLSLSRFSSVAQIDAAAERISSVVRRMRSRA